VAFAAGGEHRLPARAQDGAEGPGREVHIVAVVAALQAQLARRVPVPEVRVSGVGLGSPDATAFAPLGIVIWLSIYRDDAAAHAELIADARQRAGTAFEVLANRLAGRHWILGDGFSAADIMLGFTLLAARLLGLADAGSPLGAYLARLEARPAFQRALERTGGFA
jgi:hypothetical protein